MSLNSRRPYFILAFLVAVPALLYSNPQQKAAPKPNPFEARITALEAGAKKSAERIEALEKLTETQTKTLEEADLRITRAANQLQEFASSTAVKRLREDLTALKSDVDTLRGQSDDITRLRNTANGLADDLKKVADETDDLRRKLSDNDSSDLKRKIDELRDETRKLRDRQGELDRIGDKHEQRLNKLESKGSARESLRRLSRKMDDDLDSLSREDLIAEVKRLREGIRAHRDTRMHELCWHHPQLWSLLPEKSDPLPDVPAWPQFMRGCIRYRQSLDEQLPNVPRIEEEFQA